MFLFIEELIENLNRQNNTFDNGDEILSKIINTEDPDKLKKIYMEIKNKLIKTNDGSVNPINWIMLLEKFNQMCKQTHRLNSEKSREEVFHLNSIFSEISDEEKNLIDLEEKNIYVFFAQGESRDKNLIAVTQIIRKEKINVFELMQSLVISAVKITVFKFKETEAWKIYLDEEGEDKPITVRDNIFFKIEQNNECMNHLAFFEDAQDRKEYER